MYKPVTFLSNFDVCITLKMGPLDLQ